MVIQCTNFKIKAMIQKVGQLVIDKKILDKAVDDVINELKQSNELCVFLGDFSDTLDYYILETCTSFRSYFQLQVLSYMIVDLYCHEHDDLDFIEEGTQSDYDEVLSDIDNFWKDSNLRKSLILNISEEKYIEFMGIATQYLRNKITKI